MAEFKNLLETMSSVFNKTTTDQNSALDINDDKTLKWKTLRLNQYASKKDGRKTRSSGGSSRVTSTIDNLVHTESDVDIKEENEEESWDCNSSTSSDHKSFIRTRKRAKDFKNQEINKQIISTRKSRRKSKIKRKLSNVQQITKIPSIPTTQSISNKNIITVSSTNVVNNNNNSNAGASSQLSSLDEEVFRSFGQTVALQLKELNKFSKIEAHKAMQEIQNLVATRIVKILAQLGGNDELISRTSPSPE